MFLRGRSCTIYRLGDFQKAHLLPSSLFSNHLRLTEMQSGEFLFCFTASVFHRLFHCIHYQLARSQWLATSLRLVSQQMWHVGQPWWSAECELERRKENKKGMKHRMERWRESDLLNCRWKEKKETKQEAFIELAMIQGRLWMHFSDAIPGALECVWMCVVGGGAGDSEKGQNKKCSHKTFGCQATGLQEPVSYEEWWCMT